MNRSNDGSGPGVSSHQVARPAADHSKPALTPARGPAFHFEAPQSQTSWEAREQRPFQRKRAPDGEADTAGGADSASAPEVSSGASMQPHVQQKMERSLGADFTDVRIHQDASASRVGALAYTRGNDVVFAPGRYDPASQSGQELLGHELTHVVQQKQGRVAAPMQAKGAPINADPGLEAEADRVGAAAARGDRAPIAGGGPESSTGDGPIQRQIDPSLRDSTALDLADQNEETAKLIAPLLDEFDPKRVAWLKSDVPLALQHLDKSTRARLVLNFDLNGGTGPAAVFALQHSEDDKTLKKLLDLSLEHANKIDVLTYLAKYLADETQLKLAKDTLEKFEGDAGKATIDMASLAKYNFDPGLRSWAEQQAQTDTKPAYDKAILKAQTTKDSVYESNVLTPKPTGKKANKTSLARHKRETDKSTKARKEADDAFVKAEKEAGEEREEEKVKVLTKIEAFIEQHTPTVGKDNLDFIVRLVKGDLTMAADMVGLFSHEKVKAANPQQSGTWAFQNSGGDRTRLLALISHLEDATAEGLSVANAHVACPVAIKLKLGKEHSKWLYSQAAVDFKRLEESRELLEVRPKELTEGVKLLGTIFAKGLALDEVVLAAADLPFKKINWSLEKTADVWLEAKKLHTLMNDQAHMTTDQLDPLLVLVTLDEMITLLGKVMPGKGKAQPELVNTMLVAVGNKKTLIDLVTFKSGFSAEKLKDYIVTKGMSGTILLELLVGSHKATELEQFFTSYIDDLPTVKTLLTGRTVTQLSDILKDHWATGSAYYVDKKTRAERIVEASTAAGGSGWNKGTFSDVTGTLLYHHHKHVVLEGLGTSIVTYAGNAVATWNDYGSTPNKYHVSVTSLGGTKLKRKNSTVGGIYTSGGQPLSYWYQ